ncbi:dephospho-CoA kinase [Zavarzinella formosa]|uniref:dephospho-CoA kinase n=1 Tax=Zavarzinella formosa TaxID=360055 RepID=UPI0004964D91|nr:dephospho-CoA kinase [Zavarzinella formosa]
MSERRHKMVIGLVGGIGAGKSTVADALVRHGGRVIAGDPVGHEALRDPAILARVTELWGHRDILKPDGQVDRRKLGAIVFPSPVERARLEHLVHPYIRRRLEEEITAAQADPAVAFVILDAAVMLEAGWNNACDKLVYVDAPREVRLGRVQSQRGWTEADLASREAVQMPPERKKELADAIVNNAETPEHTRAQVDDLVSSWNLV